MYVNREIINEKLAKIHPSVEYQGRRVEFELQEVPISTARQAVDFFNKQIDLDLYMKTCDTGGGKAKIELVDKVWRPSLEQLIHMENERIICKYDFNYWAERYYLISNAENKFILYSPNPAQRVWDSIDARLERARLAIKRMNAKARQQGSTTHSQGKVLNRLIFIPDIKGVIASFDDDATGTMSGMILDALIRQPFWLRPQMKGLRSDEYYLLENNSFLNLATGQNKTLSTGTTPTVAHISEVSRFKYPTEAIYESLVPAMHESPAIFLVLESTAKGRGVGNFWHDLWKESIANLDSGLYLLYPSFIPYFIRPDFYPTETWIRQRSEAFSNWKPSDDTIIHAAKARNYVLNNRDLQSILGSNYHLPKEKMFWYEIMKGQAKKKGELNVFLQEYPADPEEMFQNSGKGHYPIELVSEYNDKAQTRTPEVYILEGSPDEINSDLFAMNQNVEVDVNKPRIEIAAKWGSTPTSRYSLVPIIFNGWERFVPENKILIWQHPQRNFEYGVSVDTSDGLGKGSSDDATIEGVRKGTVEMNDFQAFEFASPDLPQIQLWPYIYAMASYYSTPLFRSGFWNMVQALVTIEINKGEEAQNQLIKRGWWNLFRRYDPTIQQSAQQANRFGINTGPGNRPKLVSHFNSLLVGRWLELNSIPLLSEIKDLTKQGEKILGRKDNRFMALVIGLYALHRDEILGKQQASWEQKKLAERGVITNLPTFNAELQLSEFPFRGTISPMDRERGNLNTAAKNLREFLDFEDWMD